MVAKDISIHLGLILRGQVTARIVRAPSREREIVRTLKEVNHDRTHSFRCESDGVE